MSATCWFGPGRRKPLKSEPQMRLQVYEENVNEEPQGVSSEANNDAVLPLKTILEEKSIQSTNAASGKYKL